MTPAIIKTLFFAFAALAALATLWNVWKDSK